MKTDWNTHNGCRWDARADKTLRLMVRMGFSSDLIAARLLRTLASVERRRSQITAPQRGQPTSRPWTADEDAQVLAWASECKGRRTRGPGETSRDVAARLGRTRNAVIGRAHRLTRSSMLGMR